MERTREYGSRYAKVHDAIGAGDIYQANLSFRSRFRFMGDPLALYRDLRTQDRWRPHIAPSSIATANATS